MSEGCGAHGKLTSVNIVKPHHAQAPVAGCGLVRHRKRHFLEDDFMVAVEK
jgi:hypothetical protein